MPGNPACIHSMLPRVRQARQAEFLLARATDNPLKIVVERSLRTLNCSSKQAAYTPEPPGSFRAKQLSQATFRVFIAPRCSFRGTPPSDFLPGVTHLSREQTLRAASYSRCRKSPC